jgi:hypothetical protein
VPGVLCGKLIAGPVKNVAARLERRPAAKSMRVTVLAISVCMLMLCVSCPSEVARPPATEPTEDWEGVTVFFTGSELSALKPCGCSGGQLGGLEKRPGIFAAARTNRLIVDTGSLVRSDSEQDLIKFRIMFEAFGLLRYDAICLTGQDLEMARRLDTLNGGGRSFRIVSASGPEAGIAPCYSKRFTIGGRTVAMNVAAFDVRTGPISQAAGLFPDGGGAGEVNILVVHNGEGRAPEDVLTAVPPGIDCVVCPSDSDEAQLVSVAGAKPVGFTVGRFGRFVCRVDVTVPKQAGPLELRFAAIPVEETLANDKALVDLYRAYQQLVVDSRLLERYPRIPLPDDLTYTGSADCARCHVYAYNLWSKEPHANALATLKKVGSDRDPECVVCHVVGMEYAEGFISEEQTPLLKDVGCEVCHGPGSAHAAAPKEMATTEPQTDCLGCHTPEHSGGYAGHEEEYMKKIVHWWEP